MTDTFSRFATVRSGPGPLVWGLDRAGAVVGPLHIEPGLDLASAQALFLAPGAGAQGATPEDVARVFAASPRPGHAQRVEVAAGRRS